MVSTSGMMETIRPMYVVIWRGSDGAASCGDISWSIEVSKRCQLNYQDK